MRKINREQLLEDVGEMVEYLIESADSIEDIIIFKAATEYVCLEEAGYDEESTLVLETYLEDNKEYVKSLILEGYDEDSIISVLHEQEDHKLKLEESIHEVYESNYNDYDYLVISEACEFIINESMGGRPKARRDAMEQENIANAQKAKRLENRRAENRAATEAETSPAKKAEAARKAKKAEEARIAREERNAKNPEKVEKAKTKKIVSGRERNVAETNRKNLMQSLEPKIAENEAKAVQRKLVSPTVQKKAIEINKRIASPEFVGPRNFMGPMLPPNAKGAASKLSRLSRFGKAGKIAAGGLGLAAGGLGLYNYNKTAKEQPKLQSLLDRAKEKSLGLYDRSANAFNNMSTNQKIAAGLGGGAVVGGAAYLANKLRKKRKEKQKGLEEAGGGALVGAGLGAAAGVGSAKLYKSVREKGLRRQIFELKAELDNCKSESCKEDKKSEIKAIHDQLAKIKHGRGMELVGGAMGTVAGAGVGGGIEASKAYKRWNRSPLQKLLNP